MYPILFEWGGFKIYSWGFMLAVACLISVWGMNRMFRQQGYPAGLSLDLMLAVIVGGLLGARISYVLVYRWDEFLNNPLYLIQFNGTGLMWYGGLVTGFLAFWLIITVKRLHFWNVADTVAPFVALGYSVVRGGCFLAGCCYGKPTESFLGVVFHVVDDAARWPTQLFSSAASLVIFLVLLILWRRRAFTGQVVSFYLVLYAIYRFAMEFLRASEVYYGWLSPSQVISIGIFIVGIICYIYTRHNYQERITYYSRIDRFPY
jgi:phosphatidylglycerol:prolipoprotein diacylglycerol transferase